MGTRRAPSAAVAVGFVVAVCFLALAKAPARVQQGSTPAPTAPGNRDPFADARERRQREAQLRSAEMLGAVKTKDRRAAEASAEQLREDFRSLQVLRNKLVRQLQSEKPLDYKLIAGEVGEINKRAGRLRTRLAPPSAEGEKDEQVKEVEVADAEVKDALVTMCRRIDSFTENPVFVTPDVVNVEQSAKAARDLRDVIRFSAAIKKTAERLNKSPSK